MDEKQSQQQGMAQDFMRMANIFIGHIVSLVISLFLIMEEERPLTLRGIPKIVMRMAKIVLHEILLLVLVLASAAASLAIVYYIGPIVFSLPGFLIALLLVIGFYLFGLILTVLLRIIVFLIDVVVYLNNFPDD